MRFTNQKWMTFEKRLIASRTILDRFKLRLGQMFFTSLPNWPTRWPLQTYRPTRLSTVNFVVDAPIGQWDRALLLSVCTLLRTKWLEKIAFCTLVEMVKKWMIRYLIVAESTLTTIGRSTLSGKITFMNPLPRIAFLFEIFFHGAFVSSPAFYPAGYGLAVTENIFFKTLLKRRFSGVPAYRNSYLYYTRSPDGFLF